MKPLTDYDLECLSIGSAILGSGGGGDSSYALLMAKYQMERYGPVDLISVEDLKAEDCVVPLATIGAPLVTMERLLGSKQLEEPLIRIEKELGRKPTVLMPGEIGGANAFTPLLIAAKLGLPVLDADLIGRAFPELQMNSCNLKGLRATPAVLTDCLGNSQFVDAPNVEALEKLARNITMEMGSSASITLHLMSGSEAKKAVVPHSFSRAITLGKMIYEARETGKNPIAALIAGSEGKFLGRGTLIDIRQEISGGFLEGSVALLGDAGKVNIFYQNEYLLATDESGPIASTPDILMLIEENSGTPITSDSLRYGLQVALVAIVAPPIWQTAEGLAIVGPRAFGYEMDYQPVVERLR
jgi:DUF917 family protein